MKTNDLSSLLREIRIADGTARNAELGARNAASNRDICAREILELKAKAASVDDPADWAAHMVEMDRQEKWLTTQVENAANYLEEARIARNDAASARKKLAKIRDAQKAAVAKVAADIEALM